MYCYLIIFVYAYSYIGTYTYIHNHIHNTHIHICVYMLVYKSNTNTHTHICHYRPIWTVLKCINGAISLQRNKIQAFGNTIVIYFSYVLFYFHTDSFSNVLRKTIECYICYLSPPTLNWWMNELLSVLLYLIIMRYKQLSYNCSHKKYKKSNKYLIVLKLYYIRTC